jgi:membrane associated rhomboid family serine protease
MKSKIKHQTPIGNYIVLVLMSIVFLLQFHGDPQQIYLNGLILKTPTFGGFFGYFWLHECPIHIVSNMLLLIVFGRAVCTKMSHSKYFLVYIILGLAAGLGHILFDGRDVIGSSGAISGVMGMAIVLSWKKLSPMGPWLVLTWLIISIVSSASGTSHDAHVAHISGFIAGMLLAIVLVIFNHADATDTDPAIKQVFCPL